MDQPGPQPTPGQELQSKRARLTPAEESVGELPTRYREPEDDTYRSIVNLERYPIDDLDGAPCQAIIAEAAARWRDVGATHFPGFIREEVRAKIASEVFPEARLLSHRRAYTAAYLAPGTVQKHTSGVAAGDDDHPLHRLFQTHVHAVAADQVPRNTLLRQLYDSPQVAAFFARVIGKEQLYQYDDEFQKLNVMWVRDGGQRSWHYDGSDFVATLLVQQADQGGEFEFAPFIRGKATGSVGFDERFEDVRALFDGTYAGRHLTGRAESGTMQLFNGLRSLHRVRAVYGPKTRISAVLSYDTSAPEGQYHRSVETNVRLYGERVRGSNLWRRSQEARRRVCAALGKALVVHETESAL